MIVNHVSRLLGERRESVRDLQRGTGLAYAGLYRWYRGTVTRFDADTLDALCRYFGCKVGDIIEYRPDQSATIEGD